MKYVPFGSNGDSSNSNISGWGLLQKENNNKWYLAFCLNDKFYGKDLLFDGCAINLGDKKVNLSVLRFLGITIDGDNLTPDNCPKIEAKESLTNAGIQVNDAKLLIIDKQLTLDLPIRLELSESIGFSLGTLQVTANSSQGATFGLCRSDGTTLALPCDTLEFPLASLSLGPLLRVIPLNTTQQSKDNTIKISLSTKRVVFPPLSLEVNLICPMDKDKKSLLQLPTNPSLTLTCNTGIDLPLIDNKNIDFNVNTSPIDLPSLLPSFGTLIDQAVSVQLQLSEPWKLVNEGTSNPILKLKGNVRFKILIGNGAQENPFSANLEFDLQKGCLSESVVKIECLNNPSILNLGVFAFKLVPSSTSPAKINFDLLTGDLRIHGSEAKVQVYLPGFDDLNVSSPNQTDEAAKRFLFDLERPPTPLDLQNKDAIFLMGPRGLSFYAKQNSQEVKMTNENLKPLQPLEESNGIQSILEVRRNQIIQATFFARTELPGFSRETPIKVLAEIAMRQQSPRNKPELLAALQLEKADGKPLGTLAIGPLESQVDDIRMEMKWAETGWALGAKIDGKLWLKSNLSGLLSGFSKEKPVCFLDLNLITLMNSNDFALQLSDTPRLDLLNGMVNATLTDLRFKCDNGGPLNITCNKSAFHFKVSGPVEVDVQPGPLTLSIPIHDAGCPSLRLGNGGQPVSLTAKLGPSVTLNGQIQGMDNPGTANQPQEKGIGVAGAIEIKGLSSIRAAAYFGCDEKVSGETTLSAFVYAETDTDIQLYPGVYLKSVGAGMGLNRQLEAIGVNPRPEQILPRMNTLKPGNLDAWKFVRTPNFYLSLVASIMVGSVAGNNEQISPFLLWLILSIDSQANITAAAKLWLSSSPKFVTGEANFSRPAAEAALVILPQKRMLSMRVRTKKGTAIEKGDELKQILDKCDVQFSYFMSPTLLDFYLEQASYNTQWIGLNWQVLGTFRTVIVSFGAMSKATLLATANFDRKLGGSSAGAKFTAKLRLALEIVGLISSGELYSYAMVAASISAEAELWLQISIKVFGKEFSKRFSTTKRINAVLSGTMAFQSSGSAGIRASVAIKTSICGHPHSASGRFDVTDELVESIRSRVTLFEKRLQVFKDKQQASMSRMPMANSVNRSSTAFFSLLAFPTPETDLSQSSQWVVYFFPGKDNGKNRLLVMPTSENTSWLGILEKTQDLSGSQPSFRTRLSEIEVKYQDSQLLASTKKISLPGNIDAASDLEMALLGSFQDTNDTYTVDWLNATLLQDFRICSASRNYWTDLDRARLADGVLPLDFKSLDEVEEEGQADSIFEEVSLYLSRNQKAHRRYRHGLHLINNQSEKIRALRGLVCQEAVRLLNTNTINSDIEALLPCVEIISEPNELRLTFDGAMSKPPVIIPVNISSADLNQSIQAITICKPRQRCVVTRDNPYLEVKIPIYFSTEPKRKLAKEIIGEFLHRIDSFEVYRQLPNEKQPTLLADNIQLSFREIMDDSKQFLILDPYLLTDRFDLVWNPDFTQLTFKDSRLTPSAMPEVLYEVRVKPLAPDKAEKLIALGSHRVPLQLLQPAPSLTDLVASIKVTSLLDESPLKAMKIGRINADKFECLQFNDPLFNNPDSHDNEANYLEVWLEESLIEAEGFFGEPIVLRDPKRPDTLDELKTRPAQSRHGKVLVAHWTRNGVVFPESRGEFNLKSGHTYRIFVGHRSTGSWQGLLTELPCALLGEINQEEWQFSSSIERITEEGNPRYLSANEFEMQQASLSRNIFRLRVHPINGALLGGFEVQMRDQHEPHLNITLQREIISQKYFLCSEMDFRNDSLWEFASPPGQDAVEESAKDITAYSLNDFYIDKSNYQREQLIQAAISVQQLLHETSTSWFNLYQKSQEFWSAVWAYQRTGAYVNSHDCWEELKMLFRFIFTGLIPPTERTLPRLREQWDVCSKTLLVIENTDVQQLVADGEEDRNQRLADFEAASQMVAIIRHCQEITEEIFGNAAPDVPVLPDDKDKVLPGVAAWPKVAQDSKNFPLTNLVWELFGDRQTRQTDLLDDLLGKCPEKDPTTLNDKVLDRPGDIQACVTHCTALADLIFCLKAHLLGKQWELVKRPHHIIQSTMSGSMRVPVPTDIKDLLPPQTESPQKDHASEIPYPPMYFANALERLGFAVDLAAYDALGQPVNAQLLYDELNQHSKNLNPNYRRVVWLPQENRGPEPDEVELQNDKPAPYSFIKVALIPETFILENDLETSDNPDSFANFLNKRGITGTPNERQRLHQFMLDNLKRLGTHSKELRMRPVGHRWLSLCSTAGHTTSYWDGYDNKRHVFKVSVRAMSRYERLLRWARAGSYEINSLPEPPKPYRLVRTIREFTAEEKKALFAPRPVYVHQNPNRIQFSYSLPAEGARALMNNLSAVRSGWRGVEVAFGHQINCESNQFFDYIKTLIPTQPNPKAELRHESVKRPREMELTAEINCTGTVIKVDDTLGCPDPLEESYLLVGQEIMKLCSINSHSELLVQRSQLGTVATCHKIGESLRLFDQVLRFIVAEPYYTSRRTIKLQSDNSSSFQVIPYCYMAIENELFWIKAVSSDGLTLLLDYGQLGTDNANHLQGVKAMMLLPAEETGELRMFRNERLLSSPNLPYCFEYRMGARVLYEYNAGSWPVQSPDRDSGRPLPVAAREPTRLARWSLINVPSVNANNSAESNNSVGVSLILSRYWDLMIEKEQYQYMQMIGQENMDRPSIAFCPDPYLCYELFYFYPVKSDDPKKRRGVFFHLETVLMPLANGYPQPPNTVSGEWNPMCVKANSALPICATTDPGENNPFYQVHLNLRLPQEISPKEFSLEQLCLQIRRNALSTSLRTHPDISPWSNS
jgi:hypothetical protein